MRIWVASCQPTIIGVHVEDEGDIDPAGPGPYIGQVGDPQLVGPARGEAPVDQVRRARGRRLGNRGAAALPADHALQAVLAHQPFDCAAGRDHALAPQLAVDPPGLMADRAWDLPAAGGSILDQWPTIAAAVSSRLPEHVQAVAFHTENGQLDLRPDSPAYATQLRLITARIIHAANEAAGSEAVRTVRVLPVGALAPKSTTATSAQAPAKACAAASEAPVTGSKTASEGYRRALAAHQIGKRNRVVNPAIRAAAERQTREQAREPEELFGDGRQALEELRAKAAREGSSDASRARALQRLAAERAGLPTVKAAPAAVPFSRTA